VYSPCSPAALFLTHVLPSAFFYFLTLFVLAQISGSARGKKIYIGTTRNVVEGYVRYDLRLIQVRK
jgi:hypothetical protein